MEVVVHNGIERCPEQCVFADIRFRKELHHGSQGACVTGVEVVVTCSHAAVCRRLAEKLAERG